MNTTVIDTLRFANRLKTAGVDGRQAEAMAVAFNEELATGVATRQDLDQAVDKLTARIDQVEAKFDAKFAALGNQFATQNRYVFLILALLVALGLYNAVAPHQHPVAEPRQESLPVEAAREGNKPTSSP